jgi:hypothetical protein
MSLITKDMKMKFIQYIVNLLGVLSNNGKKQKAPMRKAPMRCGSFTAPKMTTAEIHALTGVEDGMIVYNTDTRQLLFHGTGSWLAINRE